MERRNERVNSLILKEVSELLQRQVKDPRLGDFVTVTEVITSPDMKHARIFVSRLCTSENKKKEQEETLLALSSASGFMRRELSKKIRLRHIPELTFEWDDSLERGDRLLRMINEVCEDKTTEDAGNSKRK